MTVREQLRASTVGNAGIAHLLDATVYDEAVDLYSTLSVQTFADHSTHLLNPPTLIERLEVAAAVKALGNSPLLHLLIPTGVTIARLYFLVAFMEGLVMPQIQMLVDLAEESGHVGAGKAGRTELDRARRNISPAFTFLTGTAAAIFRSAPALAGEISWVVTDNIPQLRNSVAHFRYRVAESHRPAKDTQAFRDLGPINHLGVRLLEIIARAARFPSFHEGRVPDYMNSSIQYFSGLLDLIQSRPFHEIHPGYVVERIVAAE